MLVWRNQNGTFRPFVEKDFDKELKRLDAVLLRQISNHRHLNKTLIQNSFDVYMWHFGLSLAEYWHITERWKLTVEMPVRYTVVQLNNLAKSFFSAHNQWLEAIQDAHTLPA